MPLANTLQWIYCRTVAERETLLFLLGDRGSEWSSRIVISDDLLVFERKYVFVDSVAMSPNGLVFQLNPRVDQKKIHMKADAWGKDGKQVISFLNGELDAQPPAAEGKRWRIAANLPNGTYLVHIDLEGHLAYRGYLALGPRLV